MDWFDEDDDDEENDDEIFKHLSIRQLLIGIYKFLCKLTREYDQKTREMTVSSKELEGLFQMRDRTLTRWRNNKTLRYHVRKNGTVYHMFTEVFTDVKSGRIEGKGFDRLATLDRLRAFRRGRLKGSK